MKFICLELVGGGELFDSLAAPTKNAKTYTEKDAAAIMKTVLLALQHLHAQNIIHRDIKPENIMFGSDGQIRMVDLGLAKHGDVTNS